MIVRAEHAALTRRGVLITVAAIVLLAIGSTVVLAAGVDGFGSTGPGREIRGAACASPVLPGITVAVRLVDMHSTMGLGGMMDGRGMMGAPGGMLGPGRGSMDRADRPPLHRDSMRVLVAPTSVRAGTVSLAVANAGYLRHELVVLPLLDGQHADNRTVGPDGTVDESGNLGEASATCAAGAGDGIAAGSLGWVSLQLPAGRYELICNLPGHYTAGMFAELTVT